MRKFIFLTLTFIPFSGHAHIESLDAIQVVEHNDPQGLVEFVPAATTIKGKELQKRRQTSVGDTLQAEAGVNSTSFGPNASRPVIRGLDGDRVKVLQNGLGTLDASTQSLDHAIPVDMLTIDQVEVVRGPMALLYGSSAVGGVVNLVTNRIHQVYEEGFFSQALVQGETANPGVSSGLHLNYGKKNWMFHADGSTRNLADQRLPSHLRGGAAQKKGKLPNSFNQQDNLAAGVSKIGDRGYVGGSFNHFHSTYGSVADDEVTIDMNQNRGEFHGEWRPESGPFAKLRLKSAQSDYKHREIEGSATGTRFTNRGNESRLEAHNRKHDVEGVSGVQTQLFKFKAVGDEAFLPNSDNMKAALFTLQKLNSVSAGARIEQSTVKVPSDKRSFTLYNASLGHTLRFDEIHALNLSVSYTERAPNFQELYASGDHLATGAFEQGTRQLKKEKAYAFELSFRAKGEKSELVVNGFGQVFKDFISLNPTGLTGNSPENLPEFSYQQVDAFFYGADAEGRHRLARLGKGVLTLVSTADIVRAKDTDTGKNLPRISPPRISAGMEFARDRFNADLEVQYVAHQTKTAVNESSTDSYTMTNLGASWDFSGQDSHVTLFGRVRNIFDVEARNHVSTLKEIAPWPGRNFILGLQAQL